MNPLTAVDLSHWNGEVNFKNLKKAGIDCVIIQAGFGMDVSQKDDMFETYYKQAIKNGFKVGAYLYSYATDLSQIKRETEVFLEWIKGKTFDLPLYIDMEEENLTYLGKSALTEFALIFCEIIENHGCKAGVYANANWFTNHLDYGKISKKYSVWLAQYASEKSLDCDIWQYTEKGTIKGENCCFDMNIIYKNPCETKTTVKIKSSAGGYARAETDPIGGSVQRKTIFKKGTAVRWVDDDGYGWSKVKYQGRMFWVINGRINKKDLSKCPTTKLPKGTPLLPLNKSKTAFEKTVILKKEKTFTVICIITQGKYKGYYYLKRNGRYYYAKA